MCSLFNAANSALTLDHRHDNALLHGGWALIAIAVDTVEELFLESHLIERVDSPLARHGC
jgi:hypothetical protein